MRLEILPLADRPDLLPLVTGWVYEQWGRDWPGSTRVTVEADMESYLRRDGLPMALVALVDGRCVGTAGLRAHTAGFPEHLSPWLVRVFVAPEARGAGVGRALVGAAEGAARDGRATALYLCTPDRQSFYAALGWATIGQALYEGQPVVVMNRMLSP